jgi:choline/glycine/proline betaine transport protein
VRPALNEVAAELGRHDVDAEVVDTVIETRGGDTQPGVLLRTTSSTEPFIYSVVLTEGPVPTYGGRMIQSRDSRARLVVHLEAGGQDYDVMGYTQGQIIHDCLDHYEQHLQFVRLGLDPRSRARAGSP